MAINKSEIEKEKTEKETETDTYLETENESQKNKKIDREKVTRLIDENKKVVQDRESHNF